MSRFQPVFYLLTMSLIHNIVSALWLQMYMLCYASYVTWTLHITTFFLIMHLIDIKVTWPWNALVLLFLMILRTQSYLIMVHWKKKTRNFLVFIFLFFSPLFIFIMSEIQATPPTVDTTSQKLVDSPIPSATERKLIIILSFSLNILTVYICSSCKWNCTFCW